MRIADQTLIDFFEAAKKIFFARESDNITNRISERNLCGRLAYYLETLLPKYGLSKYYADPEYNRKQNGEIKTILDDKHTVVTICCDLVIHSRGKIIPHDNLIAIEMKKADRPSNEKIKDKLRLRALTKTSYDGVWSNDGVTHPEHVCGYSFGIYMELDGKNKTCLLEIYQRGNHISMETISF